jgi:hypothetical protein
MTRPVNDLGAVGRNIVRADHAAVGKLFRLGSDHHGR